MGVSVDSSVGSSVGVSVGASVGSSVGAPVGSSVGASVGASVVSGNVFTTRTSASSLLRVVLPIFAVTKIEYSVSAWQLSIEYSGIVEELCKSPFT